MEIKKPQSKQPIPPDAKCVFKGAIFDVYQWEQAQYDGTTRTFEKLKRPDTVVVIGVTPENKLLISRQEQPGKAPFVGLLGGRIDGDEEPLLAAKRELLEESGYESDDWDLYFAIQPVAKVEWALYYFVARGCRRVTEQELDGGEKIEVMEVGFDEFIEEACKEGFGDFELQHKILEARLDPKKMEEFKKLLFK